jgi:uracil-DNA glycosylase
MDLWTHIPPAWRKPLESVRVDVAALSRELQSHTDVIPAADQIFAALRVAPEQVRVVIVGQDPYPRRAHACGLAFSVPPGTQPLPASLRNIVREVADDVGPTLVVDGDLSSWADQGVLLLNRTLTTSEGTSDAHRGLGWDRITEHIVSTIVAVNPDVVAVLWGNAARELSHLFNPQCVVMSAHPSPLSAHRGFFGSKPFSAVNAILQQRHQPAIRW